MILPRGLKTIHFGEDSNQSLDDTTLPNILQSMTFGYCFRQSLDNLTFGRFFNKSLDNTALPSGLQSLTLGCF